MKTISILLFTISLSSFAATETPSHPCIKIKEACESAGFKRGEHKNKKGLGIDCMQKILAGESVEGVSVDSTSIQQCKDMRDNHRQKKMKRQ